MRVLVPFMLSYLGSVLSTISGSGGVRANVEHQSTHLI